MRNTVPALFDLMASKGINLLGITETWLTTTETLTDLVELTPPPLVSSSSYPQKRRGWEELACLFAYKVSPISPSTQAGFELIAGKIVC